MSDHLSFLFFDWSFSPSILSGQIHNLTEIVLPLKEKVYFLCKDNDIQPSCFKK